MKTQVYTVSEIQNMNVLDAIELSVEHIHVRGRQTCGKQRNAYFGWKLCASQLFSRDHRFAGGKRVGRLSVFQSKYVRYCQHAGLPLSEPEERRYAK